MSEKINVLVKVKTGNGISSRDPICKVIESQYLSLTPTKAQHARYEQQLPFNKQRKEILFKFEKCFGADCTQLQFYNGSIADYVNHALDGYNCCVMTFGQTGAGKTYTMIGENRSEGTGLVLRFSQDLFKKAYKLGFNQHTMQVKCSILEIYNDEIIDLLPQDSTDKKSKLKCKLRERQDKSIFVQNLNEIEVTSVDQIKTLIASGFEKRTTKETLKNKNSSRSHAILSITINTTRVVNGVTIKKYSVCRFADLAGSEKAAATLDFVPGRLKEGSDINLCLSTLGRVITLLDKTSNTDQNGKNGKTVIPFRDSLLTLLLRENLAGNCKTTLICCVADTEYEESLSTLRYAQSAKNIQIRPSINLVRCNSRNTMSTAATNVFDSQSKKTEETLILCRKLNKYIEMQSSKNLAIIEKSEKETAATQMLQLKTVKILQSVLALLSQTDKNLRDERSSLMTDCELLEQKLSENRKKFHEIIISNSGQNSQLPPL